MQAPNSKTLVAALALVLITLSAWPASAQEDQKPAPTATAEQGQTQAAAADGITRVVSRMWWNQPEKVEKVGLQAEQRSKMDALARAYLEKQRGNTASRDAFAVFAEALQAGDWQAARERSRGLAEATSGPVQAQAGLMIDVMALLSADQRTKLAADFPGLLSGPWMRMRGMGRQRPGARPR